MYGFSESSLEKLETCDMRLQNTLKKAIKIVDFSILEGHRGKIKQNQCFKDGSSKLKYPKSYHNYYPSRGIDIAPYPINWQDLDRFCFLAGVVMGIAYQEGINLTWGGSWLNFKDYGHFQLEDK